MKTDDLHLLQEAYSRLYDTPEEEETEEQAAESEMLYNNLLHDEEFVVELKNRQGGIGESVPEDEIKAVGWDNGYNISPSMAERINDFLQDADLDDYISDQERD
jgi:hypothetical protein